MVTLLPSAENDIKLANNFQKTFFKHNLLNRDYET